jgi:hypothetical protein
MTDRASRATWLALILLGLLAPTAVLGLTPDSDEIRTLLVSGHRRPRSSRSSPATTSTRVLAVGARFDRNLREHPSLPASNVAGHSDSADAAFLRAEFASREEALMAGLLLTVITIMLVLAERAYYSAPSFFAP